MIVKPAPVTNFYINILGMILLYLCLFYANLYDHGFTKRYLYFLPFVYAIPILIYEIFQRKIYLNQATGLGSPNGYSTGRVAIKIWGLIVTISIIYFLYWLLPIYSNDEYRPFFKFAKRIAPYLAILVIPYFIYIDSRMKDPHDAYYQVGRLFLGEWSNLDRNKLFEHVRSWVIKAFFLPIMSGYLFDNFRAFNKYDIMDFQDFSRFVSFALLIIYIADLTPVVFGYIFNMRFFDNHIISTDRNWLGWLSCLVCYTPFWGSLFYWNFFRYSEGPDWVYWTSDHPLLHYIWGSAIIVFMTCYSSASVVFGLRWSNLTYRGLMSNGPYRFTKHPAYIAKNISWWLMSMPFMYNGSWQNCIRASLLLICVNTIYTMRALTEERHLSKFPEYVQYAKYIDQNGIFKFMNKIFPALRYYVGKYAIDPK